MDTNKMRETSDQAFALLHALASSIDVPYPHWVGGDNADQGPSYCRPCADAEVLAERAEYVDGGWQQENDGCCHCETCGRLLEYVLTSHGAAEEIDHYQAVEFTAPLSPEDAFHIAKLLEHDESNTKAVSIALRAVAVIEAQGLKVAL